MHFESLSEQAGPNLSGGQILVVDDDGGVRESIAMSLMAAGYDVASAEDGFQALSLLGQRMPYLLISDLDMPGMSGFELLSVVRRRFPRILTIAMSGGHIGEELPFGVIADRFFPKGSPSQKLLTIVRGLLLTASARSNDHFRETAPVWIPRNGNDSKGLPYVVLTCTECLRAFSMNLLERTPDEILEIPCRFCHKINCYIIQPSTYSFDSASLGGT